MTEHDPLCHAANFKYHDPECCDCILIAKVRADDRERNREADGVEAYLAVEKTLIDLRAKVEDLPYLNAGGWVKRKDVLAIIDGGSDD